MEPPHRPVLNDEWIPGLASLARDDGLSYGRQSFHDH